MNAQDNLPPEVQPAALPSSSGPQEASSAVSVAPVALRQEWPSEAELEKLIAKLPASELAWAYQSGLVIRELVNQRWAANR